MPEVRVVGLKIHSVGGSIPPQGTILRRFDVLSRNRSMPTGGRVGRMQAQIFFVPRIRFVFSRRIQAQAVWPADRDEGMA